jgi:hypothetical protein
MKAIVLIPLSLFFFSALGFAQPRPADKTSTVPANLPASFEARYEGGIFGNTGKETGTLRFDDANERMLFYGKNGREMFSIPYASLMVIYPDSKESVSTAGNVISRLPLPGAGLAGLKSKSSKFLIIRYNDEDVQVEGTANFKFNDREKLLMFINALGTKAKMKQKGDAYYRSKKSVY